MIQTWSSTIKHTNGSLAIEKMRETKSLCVSLCDSFENLDYQSITPQDLDIPGRET